MANPPQTPPPAKRVPLPKGVLALGIVSLLMDVSSEMIHSLLPVFLVSVLGASTLAVGVIEGIAEATASISKIFSGVISDWIGKRKPLLLLGYGLAAVTKPLFPLASSVTMILSARFIDRIGKGIRGAPRDALVADITPAEQRGAAYGLRQALDSVGAVAGPAIAIALMAATGDRYRFVFWIALIPAILCVAVIVFGVKEPKSAQTTGRRRFPVQRAQIARLSLAYWWVVAFATVLTLARFSEAFVILRASGLGLAAQYIPTVHIMLFTAFSVSAYPFGRLADKVSKRTLLAIGIVLLVLSDLVLAAADSVPMVVLGSVIWGLHMGATEGLLSTVVADTAPEDLRGTAFGLFNMVTGAGILAASVLAGLLWTEWGPRAAFLAGGGLAALSMAGLVLARQQRL